MKSKLALEVVAEKLIEKCGKLFALYLVEKTLPDDSEEKKKIKNLQFMDQLLTGKFMDKSADFITNNQKLYDEIQELSEVAKSLTP